MKQKDTKTGNLRVKQSLIKRLHVIRHETNGKPLKIYEITNPLIEAYCIEKEKELGIVRSEQ